MTRWIVLDGRVEEGGGALLRQALGLSLFTGYPFHMHHIRAHRRPPGLRPQHLMAVRAAQELSGARVAGDHPGSTEIRFVPGRVRPGRYRIDIGTAGSITLLVQALLVPLTLLEAETEWDLQGGTDVPWSMPWDYFRHIWVPFLEPWARVECRVHQRGYYPAGGGRVWLRFRPVRGQSGSLERVRRGAFLGIRGVAHASQHLRRRRVAERLARAAQQELERHGLEAAIEVHYAPSVTPGCALVLWAAYENPAGGTLRLGASRIGERGKPAEAVGQEAARELVADIRAGYACDPYFADQVVPFLGILGGAITTRTVTPHARANVYVTRAFLGGEWEVGEHHIRCLRPHAA